ncbi:LmbE family N-acetylglucosaminyl deacetylase [Pedobacter sp. UYP30]|uniref:PIG-L family deacetylase n=1 Tax=Pedobacter sp. UYP30 TaxID=1756400 RepID=UPI003395A036
MLKYFLVVALTIFYCRSGSAQQVRPENSAAIFSGLKTLNHLPKVLYIAAHPDDENTGLLSWLINDKHVETAYLSLTRGDGGQNLLGPEQGAALGLIRTHELLEARKLDGAKQFFTRAIDFGFSKNTTDTFNQWNVDSLTANVVWVIRKFRPDVIICRFPPTAAAGHGQHAASAVVAAKAFKLAGDRNMFPEQLKYVQPWQPTRLLWNTYNFGSVNTTSNDQLQIAVGQYDPLLGMGYGELAGISRSLHKSQGAGTRSIAGKKTEYFTLVDGKSMSKSLFDGLMMDWKQNGEDAIASTLQKIITDFDFSSPEKSLPSLLALRKNIVSLKNKPLRKDKLAALDKIILSCAGFMGEVITGEPEALAGKTYPFQLNVIVRDSNSVKLKSINWLGEKQQFDQTLPDDELVVYKHDIKIPTNAALTQPYWLAKAPENAATFSVTADSLIGLPEAPAQENVLLTLTIGQEDFNVSLPLSYKKLDPVRGDVVEGLRVVPAVDVKVTEPVYFAKTNQDLTIHVQFKAKENVVDGTVEILDGEKAVATFKNIKLDALGITNKTFTITAQALDFVKANQSKLQVVFKSGGISYNKTQEIIQYPHLPTLQYFTPAESWLLKGDIKVTAKNIGYIKGAGDLIPGFLRQAGLKVDVLTESDILNPAKLSSYDAVVTGIRVVNTERRFGNWQNALHNYVKNGGTLVMQYNTTQDMATQNFAVYPLNIGRGRVTEEHAKVTFLDPDNRLLNYPNKITTEDFAGWVQERGTYFPDKWDSHYTPLFEMHDTGEPEQKGSTLVAKYGKGTFIYTPLVFFRELPAGNIGAARLFFNFLSAGK